MLTDEFDELIDKIRKHFKLDSDMFEIDFLFLPESEIEKGRIPDKEKLKGFKISYHFENGMDKPEIKIEGDIESKKVWEYLKEADLSKLPNVRELYNSQSTKEIDANTLSLESYEGVEVDNNLTILEPYTEVCNNESYTEILVEIPGINQEDVEINFREEGKKLIIRAASKSRKYLTTVALPFQSSEENCDWIINNGVVIITLRKAT